MSSKASVQPLPSANKESLPPKEKQSEDAEAKFQLKSPKFWSIIIGIYLAIFLVALDRLIIATAIPAITDEFHSTQDIGWYGSAYMLTAAIFFPLSGRIYQQYSTKWMFLTSIIIFEIGSALCGAAPSSVAFIIGRAIAGIGSAGIMSGGMMIIIPLVPLCKRPIFTSFFGVAFGVSSVIGPLIGGAFTDNASLTWRWCFYINLPVGALTFVVVLLFLQLESTPRKKLSILQQLKRLDPLGLLFFTPSMICLILALQWGGSSDPWSAPKIIGLLVTFAVLFLAFLMVEVMMPDTAMAPTRVILNRSVGGSMLVMFLLSGAMMAIVYYLTIWFQVTQSQSAFKSGIHTIPLVLSLVVIGILAAIFVQKVGYYVPPMLISPALCAVGAGMLSTLTSGSKSSHWIGYQVLYGVGLGCGFQTSNLVPQSVLLRADVPIGMALMFFMQQLGSSVFVSVGQTIFSSQLVKNLSGIPGLDTEAIINFGTTNIRSIVPASELENVVHAYSSALAKVFIMAAALSACMILGVVLLEWKSIKGQQRGSTSVVKEVSIEEAGVVVRDPEGEHCTA